MLSIYYNKNIINFFFKYFSSIFYHLSLYLILISDIMQFINSSFMFLDYMCQV